MLTGPHHPKAPLAVSGRDELPPCE